MKDSPGVCLFGPLLRGVTHLMFVVSLFGVLLYSGTSAAHETPIALLQLREIQPGTYFERWTYSTSRTTAVPEAVYPEHCTYEPPRVVCGKQGLVGKLSVPELGSRYSVAVVRIARLEKSTQSYTLTAGQTSVDLTDGGAVPTAKVAASYVPLGFEHIMLGVDHLLFVLGLLMLVTTPWTLVRTITAFTVAHSITLAAATLGWVGVPERPVNAAIALSIVFVAVEVLKFRRGEPMWSARFPWAVAFGFGLLHGFGFAGALISIGLPEANLPAALFFFNVGVELGQLAFVFVVLALAWSHRKLEVQLPKWTQSVAVYAVGATASFWFFTRAMVLLKPILA